MLIFRAFLLASGAALAAAHGVRSSTSVGWPTHGGDPSHSAVSRIPARPLNRIIWSTPLDLNPQYNGSILFAHYGSPVVTGGGVIVLPVKTGATNGFRIEARAAASGALIWKQDTDYVTPSYNDWLPPVGPTLIGDTAVYPRKAGFVAFRNVLPWASQSVKSVCFYGQANYNQDPAAFANVRVGSPLVTGEDGAIYFAYRVENNTTNPLGLKGGIARVTRSGEATYVEAATASGDAAFYRPRLNCAPAIRNGILYIAIKDAGNAGMLVGLDAETLTPLYRTRLLDPKSGLDSYVDANTTSCPSVGEDGDVYFGVLENPFPTHHYRGWLLHFDKTLRTVKTPGSFGWDDTASLVPKAAVPGYTGTSSYLILTKYNNYAGQGDGVNKVGLLDPNASQPDPYADGVSCMKEILTKASPTPDPGYVNSGYPNAVREWCINTAAIDVANHAAMVNNEDGVLYRWNLKTNTFDQRMRLNAGIGEAYTPTLIGPNGLVFAVSNARLYAIGG